MTFHIATIDIDLYIPVYSIHVIYLKCVCVCVCVCISTFFMYCPQFSEAGIVSQ